MLDSQRSVETLVRMLRHTDPSQLLYQIGEIGRDQTYLRRGVTVSSGDVVVDVGANVGVAAAFFAVICEAGVVHCFEPVAPVFELLKQNVGDLPACVLHPQGLSSRAARVPITYYPGAAAMSGLYADPERDREVVRTVLLNRGLSLQEAEEQLADRYEAQTLFCELRTFSSFVREQRLDGVDLLKIDVERAELDVLAGIEGPDWQRIKQIAMEVHDDDGRAQSIRTALESRGFHVVVDQEEIMRGTATRMLYARRGS